MGFPIQRSKLRFGLFEVKLARGELLKNRRRIPVERQPFLILGLCCWTAPEKSWRATGRADTSVRTNYRNER
jgi:hypothetical protein